MQTETKNFKIEKKQVKSLSIIGLEKTVKTNGFDAFEDGMPGSAPKANSPLAQAKPKLNTEQKSPSLNLNDDPRLSQYNRNNFNPEMLKSAPSQKKDVDSAPKLTEEEADSLKLRIKENMDFMKNMLKLYQTVKGPMKKQALILQDYKEEYYNKMVFGFQVDSLDDIGDEFIKIQVPEGEYFTLTLTKEQASKSGEMVKLAWKHLKDELGDQRSYAFDFQVADPVNKTITFYVSAL